MTTTRTVGDFLKIARVAVTPTTEEPAKAAAAAAPAPAAAAAEPAKAAAKGSAGKTIPATTPVGGKKPANDPTEKNPQDTGATGSETAAQAAPAKEASVNNLGLIVENGKVVGIDTGVYKTAQQQALARAGVFITDPATAATVFEQNKIAAEQTKKAELEKFAQEERYRGMLQYHGMTQESCAMQLADGQIGIADVLKTAAWTNCDARAIIARAEELKKIASQLAAATSSPALVDGLLGSAARTNSSEVMAAAERNGNTTETTNDAVAQTRGPTSGIDEKLLRFDTPVTLPGNPGLNQGQKVDQGKKLGE